MSYARFCRRIVDGVRCEIAPAQLVRVGDDLIDMCARHACEAAGIGGPVRLPSGIPGRGMRFPDEPQPVAGKRRPVLAGTTGELIVRYVARFPGVDRRQIAAGLDISQNVLKEWLPKLVTRGYLRAQFIERVAYYRLMEPESPPS